MKRKLFAFAIATLAGSSPTLLAGAETARTEWQKSAPAAFAEAKRTDKLVLVELYADWCGWCKVMEREVFADPEFQRYASRFVLLQVDTEDGAAGSELQRRFRATSLPTLLVLDANQSLVGEVRGYMKTAQLLPHLDQAVARHRDLIAAYDRTLAGDDPAQWLVKAQEMHQRGDGKRAVRGFEKAIASGKIAGDELAWARLQLADAYRMSERYAEAKKTAHALRADLASSARSEQGALVAERVDLLLLYIAGGEHDCGDAADALAAFEKGYPKSSYLADARRAFRATTSDSGNQCS
jgi:thioredoxin-related protein